MSAILRMSRVYAPTLKEDPSDADIASAKLLVRAGMIRKEAAGLYTFMPLGMRVLHKIQRIIREEMDSHGGQEVFMPFVQNADLWRESGRWDVYGEEMLRLTDRHENEFCLGPTHEEVITDLVKNELRSYKELPQNLYQIQLKFRDERRPRFGLLRSREFIMKDAYSFDADQEGLDESYLQMREAYSNMFSRMGFEYRIVQADSGEIGGSGSEEFMALAETGECQLVYCDCGYAADTEIGACTPAPVEYPAESLTRIETPGVHTIAELAEFLGCEEAATAKAFSGVGNDGTIWVLFVPGNYEVNEAKAKGIIPGFRPLTDEEMVEAKLVKGSMGPVGLPAGVKVAADTSLQAISRWVVGANVDGFHYTGAKLGEDFRVDAWADLCVAKVGDPCPVCGKPTQGARGIEVGQIFKLGTKYSESMGATFMGEDGKEKPFIMGCYGVGVSRTLAAAVEQSHDENGIVWPVPIAPAHVCVIPLVVKDDLVQPAAEDIARELDALGLEVAIDDRKERAGVKFADADLIGWPVQVVVGKRGLEAGTVEVKVRRTGEKMDIPREELSRVVDLLK
ncbi:MAG: proline--tRNA ligase [Coriobacteriia bacterium]|nr:proline--tRNA ligase [Coriobacteriia bacterium]